MISCLKVTTDLFLALKAREMSFPAFGTSVEDIQWRSSHFRKVFSFTNSLSNQAAHVMAKEALKRNFKGIWVEECPLSFLILYR